MFIRLGNENGKQDLTVNYLKVGVVKAIYDVPTKHQKFLSFQEDGMEEAE